MLRRTARHGSGAAAAAGLAALLLVRAAFAEAPRLSEAPDRVFRDCPECPEMLVIPAGRFRMGSTELERGVGRDARRHPRIGGRRSAASRVRLRRFALAAYPATRGEYAAFVRETGRSAGDGCGHDSFKWDKDPRLSWQAPGFTQRAHDPVVCVSWEDAQGTWPG
jgi:formylglycine-generating enzyme required for sulfatase activity